MPAAPAPQGGQSMAWTKSKRLIQAIIHEFSIVSSFPYGYRNREDITNFADLKNAGEGTLVVGSQNMLHDTSGRIKTRQGYAIDGAQLMYVQTKAIASNAITVDSTTSITTGTYAYVYFTGTSITGLTTATAYYLINASSTTLKFATTYANALAGTAMTISGTPTGASISFQKSGINVGIASSFDWNAARNVQQDMRCGFNDSGSDGRMQFRWTDANKNVWWSDLLTGLSSVNYNFTTWADASEAIRECLMVNGTPNIYEWSGAWDTVASVTSTTIVLTNSAAASGFYTATAGKMKVILRGVTYTYTWSSGTPNTLTITAGGDPTTGVHTAYAGDIVTNLVYTTANSALSGTNSPAPGAAFANALIGTLNNQVYIGSLTSPAVFVSKNTAYTDFGWANAGIRVPSDGATATLDDNVVAFVPLENAMYISCGHNFWYNTSFVQSSSYDGTVALVIETFTILPLTINPQQGTQSQALTNKIANNIVMVSNEPVLNKLGRLENILGIPQASNISDPIKIDFDSYDFTGGSVYYWKYNLFVAIPKLGIVRMFNFNLNAWEAPQTIPVTRFYTISGQLYGHSSTTSESYQLFTGYSDRAIATAEGNPYLCIANFAYQNYGVRTVQKNQNKWYMEGYISANTVLNCVINYEMDGNLTQQSFSIPGNDSQIVGLTSNSNSLGKSELGYSGLGTEVSASLTGLPPKFRVIKTFPRYDFYECQLSFSILGTDQQFQLLAFGTDAQTSDTTNYAIEE